MKGNYKMNTNINEVMNQYFDQLNIDPIEFEYDEARKKFISKESFIYDINDPEQYFIVVKISGNIGTVVVGTSDGVRFVEADVLGQIQFEGDHWINI